MVETTALYLLSAFLGRQLGCFFCVRKEGRKRRIKKEVVGPKTRKARSVLYYKLFYTIMIHTTSITAKLLLLQASCPMLLLASGYLASHSLLRFLISIATPKRNIKRKEIVTDALKHRPTSAI